MGYTNSSLVCYTKLSPNHSGQRTHSIDRITPHCVVGQLSCETICDCFPAGRDASCNYGIGKDGRISLCVEEKNRSWCSSSSANDQRAVTIECASDKTEPYAMTGAVYKSLIELCTDICRRNGKNKLIWFGDKNTSLNYAPKSNEMVLTVHRWFANKSCPGNWLYARMGDLAAKVTAKLDGSATQQTGSGMQASVLKNLSEAEVVEKVGSLFTADQRKTGILACVSMAQFILESGYGHTELAQNANNCFGMKKSLSGNTWSGSTWDGTSVYTKQTKEQKSDGTEYTITADFRKYPCIEDSISDHAAYLLGAKNGFSLRYAGLKGETDYRKAITLIKNGGYATDVTYIDKLCSIIEKWNLTRFNYTGQAADILPDTGKVWYRVRKSWTDAASQKGAFHDLANAKKCADANAGYYVFDESGKVLYPVQAFQSYLCRVEIKDLNIRTKPTIDSASHGYTGIGTFTIVEEAIGKVSKSGTTSRWGLLKSYAKNRDGWICLDYATKLK